MRYPRDVGQGHVVDRYVVPGRRYTKLLGAGFLRLDAPERAAFTQALASDAAAVSDLELDALFGYEWRARLTAAWMTGVARRTQWRDLIGRLLLESQLTYGGQGYCFALARFASPDDAAILVTYLDSYLPRVDCRYDQPTALGALMRLDALHGTERAARYTQPGGLWDRWVNELPHLRGHPAWSPEVLRQRLDDWCDPEGGWTA